MLRSLALIISGILTLVAALLLTNELRVKMAFLQQWQQDIQLMEKSGKLPALWKELGEIRLESSSSKKLITAKDVAPIKLAAKGIYKLDLLILQAENGNELNAVIQYDVVNSNGSTVFEFGRTLSLGRYYGLIFWP